jgi:hypothetical protein
MENYIVRRQITNRADFTDVERYVLLLKHTVDAEIQSTRMYCKIQYIRNGVDISYVYKEKLVVLDANNNKLVNDTDVNGNLIYIPVTDANGNPVTDANGNPVTTPKKVGQFDYIMRDIDKPVNLTDKYCFYIDFNLQIGNFDNP